MSNTFTQLKAALDLDKPIFKMEVLSYDAVSEMAQLQKTDGDIISMQSPFALVAGERVRVQDDKIISKGAVLVEIESSI